MEHTEIATRNKNLIETAEKFVVVDDGTYKQASQAIAKMKDWKKNVKDFFLPSKTKAHEAHKAVCDAEKQALGCVDDAIIIASKKCKDYYLVQQEKARQERIKAQREAEEREEEERIKMAEQAASAGLHDEAEIIISTPQPVIAPKVIETKLDEKVSYIKKYKIEVTDFKILPDEYKIANQTMLNKIATAMQDNCKIPGTKIFIDLIRVDR